VKDAKGYGLETKRLPDAILSRIDDETLGEKVRLRVEGGSRDHLHRNHPLVGAIAELLTENALDPLSDAGSSAVLARTGA